MSTSNLESMFDTLWRQLGGPPMVPELRFAPPRRFRFDRAHELARVAVELDGGVWSGGRHVRPRGYENDCEKMNLAAALGWTTFRVTGRMLATDPAGTLEPIAAMIAARTRPDDRPDDDRTDPAIARRSAVHLSQAHAIAAETPA